MTNLKTVKSIFQREFKAYFDSPVAYVFLVAFLVLVGFLTFGVTMFYERRQANLTPFFFWHPWVYLLLVPAATMGLWAEERRTGTIELLLTLPVNLLTLGLFTFVINGFLFWLAANFLEGFEVRSFGWAILAAIVYSLISWTVSALLPGRRV